MASSQYPESVTVTYTPLFRVWPHNNDLLRVSTSTGQRILTVPLSFLQKSKTNSWDYVTKITKLCMNEDDGRLVTRDLKRIADELPVAGDFVYLASGAVTFRRGPEGKSKLKPATGTSVSTMSNSKRSTINQSEFRIRLIGRDFSCLVTDSPFKTCTPSHIIPYSRQDIWLGFGIERCFETSMGLLLADTLHRSFDQYRWSLYSPDRGTYIVHRFMPESDTELQRHGMLIPRTRFRFHFESELPDPQYLAWHYQQCVLMYLRGFHHD